MTLPSQTARTRSSNARTFTRSRRQGRTKPLGAVLIAGFVVIVLGIGAWVLIGQGDGSIAGGTSDDPLANSTANGTNSREPAGDALSRPVANSANSGNRTQDPIRTITPTPTPTPTSTPSNTPSPIDARRERNPDRSPSPLAAALEADTETNAPRPTNPAPTQERQTERTAQTNPTAPNPTNTSAPNGQTNSGQAPTRAGVGDEVVLQAMRAAEAEIARGRPAAARQVLDSVYRSANTPAIQAQIRQALSALNTQLLLSPTLYAGEPLTREYTIQPGDALSRIASREKLGVEWRLLQRVNEISDPGRIRVGQKLKLVQGPFHAVVTKSAYRMDIYSGEASDRSGWRYVMSFPVGLGEGDSTPSGNFTVRPDSKLVNPHWVNPRTGERFDANDPKNPIGERWIGLDGLGSDAIKTGYGIHGTIDPASIGQQRSMGCVRLGDRDVEIVYELLMPGSLVYIVE